MRQAISAVVLGLMLARPASALECVAVPLDIRMRSAEIVLLGRIDAVRVNPGPVNGASHSIVTISVKALWKGTTRNVIELHQPFVAGGINFGTETGKDYVLFIRTITPERPLPNVAPPVTSGFAAAECISRPAAEFDAKTLGPSRTPLP